MKKGIFSKAASKIAGSKIGKAAKKVGAMAAFGAATGCTLTVGGVQTYEVDCYVGSDAYGDIYEPFECVEGDDSYYDPVYHTNVVELNRRIVSETPASECKVYVARPGDYCW